MNIPKRITAYLSFLKSYPKLNYLGSSKEGIQIITDPRTILQIEEKQKKSVSVCKNIQGLIPSWQSGIISTDRYFTVLRDPVLFANIGEMGLYDRVIYTSELISGYHGIVLCPIFGNGIVMTISFRHSIRYSDNPTGYLNAEIPGVIPLDGETSMESVHRCIEKELGGSKFFEIKSLGYLISERGLLGAKVEIYAVLLKTKNVLEIKDDIIVGHVFMSAKEYITKRQRGFFLFGEKKCLLMDSYVDSALMLAMGHGIFSFEK